MLAQAFDLSRAGRNDEALEILDRLAVQGEPEALWVLGDVHWRGQLVPTNLALGRDHMRRAAEAGHPIAARAYTNLLASGVAGPRDWPGALGRLAAEAREDGRRAAMLALIREMNLDKEGDPRIVPHGDAISKSPSILLFRHLFSDAECDYLIEAAEPAFEPSLVTDDAVRERPDPLRTSDGATMHWLIEDPAIHALNRRLAAASGTAWDQGEPVQILRYSPGQQYRNHLDYVPGIDNQRVLTALVYLNADYEGGETAFVKAGLRVKGRKGNAIIFRNALPDGGADMMAEHAGLPVASGTKYLASRWIRERRHLG